MIAERIEAARRIDWWPFTRIAITAAVLGAAAHIFLGWQPPLRQVLAMPAQMLGVLSILAMISFVLADLYLLLFLGPLYVVGVLNDWLYLASWHACRAILRLRPAWLLALGGLLGEILLFGGLAYMVRRILL